MRLPVIQTIAAIASEGIRWPHVFLQNRGSGTWVGPRFFSLTKGYGIYDYCTFSEPQLLEPESLPALRRRFYSLGKQYRWSRSPDYIGIGWRTDTFAAKMIGWKSIRHSSVVGFTIFEIFPIVQATLSTDRHVNIFGPPSVTIPWVTCALQVLRSAKKMKLPLLMHGDSILIGQDLVFCLGSKSEHNIWSILWFLNSPTCQFRTLWSMAIYTCWNANEVMSPNGGKTRQVSALSRTSLQRSARRARLVGYPSCGSLDFLTEKRYVTMSLL